MKISKSGIYDKLSEIWRDKLEEAVINKNIVDVIQEYDISIGEDSPEQVVRKMYNGKYADKIIDMIRVFDGIDDEYLKHISIGHFKHMCGNFSLESGRTDKGDMFLYNTGIREGYCVLPRIGVATKSFLAPFLLENDEVWMSVTPGEIYSMQDDIKYCRGVRKVLVCGLGLGYFPYMIGLSDKVENITIIDNNPFIIKLFKEFILPQFGEVGKKSRLYSRTQVNMYRM